MWAILLLIGIILAVPGFIDWLVEKSEQRKARREYRRWMRAMYGKPHWWRGYDRD